MLQAGHRYFKTIMTTAVPHVGQAVQISVLGERAYPAIRHLFTACVNDWIRRDI